LIELFMETLMRTGWNGDDENFGVAIISLESEPTSLRLALAINGLKLMRRYV